MILIDRLDIKNWGGYPVVSITLQWTGGANCKADLQRNTVIDVDITTLNRIAEELPKFVEKFRHTVKTLGGNI